MELTRVQLFDIFVSVSQKFLIMDDFNEPASLNDEARAGLADLDDEARAGLAEMLIEVKGELEGDILPFWSSRMLDDENGGFLGRISGEGVVEAGATKGAILNARILWTFSAAYRVLGDQRWLEAATRAKREIIDKFYDRQFGGVFWAIEPSGRPADGKKQIYALGFAIYGLAEYHRATGDPEALDYAVRLFHDIEDHSFDACGNGYFEAFTRDWKPIQDMRLSEKDRNDCKTMNTHLHVLEPYTALYRVWKDPQLETQLRNLIDIFTDKILDARTGHLQLFFDENWRHTDSMVSYGHDIEASWLLWEAAEVLGDPALSARLRPIVKQIADAATEGYEPGNGMKYEFDRATGHTDGDRHWWVQAETVVGYLNLWQLTRSGSAPTTATAAQNTSGSIPTTDATPSAEAALNKALDCWHFIRDNIVDREGGEWFWSLRADGTPNRDDDKAGFWKCPYHNSRMCLEAIERLTRSPSLAR